jgi:hypothetical protein
LEKKEEKTNADDRDGKRMAEERMIFWVNRKTTLGTLYKGLL